MLMIIYNDLQMCSFKYKDAIPFAKQALVVFSVLLSSFCRLYAIWLYCFPIPNLGLGVSKKFRF